MLLTTDGQVAVFAACSIAFAKALCQTFAPDRSEEILERYTNELDKLFQITDDREARDVLWKLRHMLMECEPGT